MSTRKAPRTQRTAAPQAETLRPLEFLLGEIAAEAHELIEGRSAADVDRLKAWVADFIAQKLGSSGYVAVLSKLMDLGERPPADGPLRSPRTRSWEFAAAFALVGASSAAERARETHTHQATFDQLLHAIVTALSIAIWDKAVASQVKRDAAFLREGNRTYKAEKTQHARELSRKRWHQRDADRSAALTFAAVLPVASRIEAARRTADMLQERRQADYTVETVDAWLKAAKWSPQGVSAPHTPR